MKRTREALRDLSRGQRLAFLSVWQSQPPAERDAYRRRIVGMTAEQRSAELGAAAAKQADESPRPR
jgi:hypothetical protein